MKEKYNNNEDPNHYGKHTHLGDLDRLAREIGAIARGCLRDGVLGGILRGYEDDIRQDVLNKSEKSFCKNVSALTFLQNGFVEK